MQLERTGNSELPYQFTFDEDEPGVIGAIFREMIAELTRKGNGESISDFEWGGIKLAAPW